ncbi:hypothetical protein ABK040_006081 [Willaertia magna]
MNSQVIKSAHRTQVISLYRRLLRIGYQWPKWETQDPDDQVFLSDFIIKKTKKEFRTNFNLSIDQVPSALDRARKEIKFLKVLQNDILKKQFVLQRSYSEAAEEVNHQK